jgi:hypothetical protein
MGGEIDVALKLFKGEATSDGLPEDEIAVRLFWFVYFKPMLIAFLLALGHDHNRGSQMLHAGVMLLHYSNFLLNSSLPYFTATLIFLNN